MYLGPNTELVWDSIPKRWAYAEARYQLLEMRMKARLFLHQLFLHHLFLHQMPVQVVLEQCQGYDQL